MKKPYIQPTTMVVKMQVTQFVMTTSLPVDPNTGTGTQLAPDFYFDDED
jgi:hypothetical protein